MSIENPSHGLEGLANNPLDLTKIGQRDEKKYSILPPALLAAKAMNKKNSLGTQEVTLPVFNKVVKCNPFSNVDESTIKSMTGSISSYNDANFTLLYNHAEFPEDAGVNSYQDFLLKLVEADFRTILYGIMQASLKNLEEQRFVCKNQKCPNPDENKIFNFTPTMSSIKIHFQKENYISPSGDHTKDLFVAESDMMTVNYKFSSIASRVELFKKHSNEEIRTNIIETGSMLTKTELNITYIDSIEVKVDEEIYKLENPQDIELFIRTLNVASREEFEKLNDRFITHIDGWVPTFSTTLTCPHCKQTQEWEDIDIYIEFFRKFTAIF